MTMMAEKRANNPPTSQTMAAAPEKYVEEERSNEPANYDGYLLAAAKRGNIASMKEVLDEHKSEVNINCADGLGNTPLHYSAMYGHQDTLELMLEAGANPNCVNFQNDTPLHRAFYKNNIPMISLLLKKGADIRKVNKSGMKPGDYAQTEEARAIREIALGATKQGLVSMPPPIPDRRSRNAISNPIVPSSEPLDYSKLPGMKVEEGDMDEDSA